tara:strand:- start:1581 stop:2123 length:543 start_codon:yes stop_codon:yes gene_type:complete
MELSNEIDNDIRNNIVSILLIVEIYEKAWRKKSNSETYKQLRSIRRTLSEIKSWNCGYKYSERIMEVIVNKDIKFSSRNHLLRKITNVDEPANHIDLRKKFRAEFEDLFMNLLETITYPKSNETCSILYLYLCCSCCYKTRIHEKFMNMFENEKALFDNGTELRNDTIPLLSTSSLNYMT